MYWDLVEVKQEPHYWRFVRFKDGVAGRLQLRPEELTGALAPLRDEYFFGHVVRLRGLATFWMNPSRPVGTNRVETIAGWPPC